MKRVILNISFRGLYITCFFFLFGLNINAQNLVYNGDFELYNKIPRTSEGWLGNCQISYCKGWDACCNNEYDSCGYSDYHYYGPSYKSISYAQPKRPYDGNAFAGFAPTFISIPSPIQYYEYITGNLISPLVIGKKYKISLAHTNGAWKVAKQKPIGHNGFGILLSTYHPVQNEFFEKLPSKAQLRTPYLMSDSVWKIMEFEFIADSAYTNITLGGFWENDQVEIKRYGGNDNPPIIYIDDLRLEPLIEIPELPAPQFICKPDSVYIENATKKLVKWWINDKFIGESKGFTYFCTQPITKIVAESYGEFDTTYISILDKPKVKLVSEGNICPWQDKKGSVSFITLDSLFSFYWLFSKQKTETPILTTPKPGIAKFIYKSPKECEWEEEILLAEDCSALSACFVPNSFSPNIDGLNDFYKLDCENILHFEIRIFNRWGEQIYKSTNPNQSWDGTYKGTSCPDGIYLAIIHIEFPTTDEKIKSENHRISLNLLR